MPTKMPVGMPKLSAPLLLQQLSTLAGDILVPVPWKCLLGIDRSVAPLMPVTAMSGLECPFALHQKIAAWFKKWGPALNVLTSVSKNGQKFFFECIYDL